MRSGDTSRRPTSGNARCSEKYLLPERATLAGMPTPDFLSRPAVLFVAHPGHELSVHGWLERARPEVFVLTDGSGGEGSARSASTARVLAACGASAGSIFGRFRDTDLYRALLESDTA